MVPVPPPGAVVIFIGIDDTDTLETQGTNQLARRLATTLPRGFRAEAVLRHQLLLDPRVPFTSHNGTASLLVREKPGRSAAQLIAPLEADMRVWFKPGSDPGLCIAAAVPEPIRAWGRRCQREVVEPEEALALAAEHGIHLVGLGGTNGGVIGALAAVGLLAAGDDGRVVHMPRWPWPDRLAGPQPLRKLQARGVTRLCDVATNEPVAPPVVDVGRHLRPAWRAGAPVLFVQRPPADGQPWIAVKLP